MKWFFSLFTLLFVVVYNNFCLNIINVEKEIYNLYVNNFDGLLIVKEDYSISIDKKKVESIFKDKDYEVIFYEDNSNLKFKIKISKILKFEKEYCFYVEKRYENN